MRYTIFLLEALDQGANDNIATWDNTTAGCDHNLGLSGIGVDLSGSCGAEELQASLKLAEMRVELLLKAEGAGLGEQRLGD